MNTKIDAIAVGRRIRNIRKDNLHIQQIDFAKQIGLSQAGLCRVEHGRIPKAIILQRIATLGKVSIEWILTGEGDTNVIF